MKKILISTIIFLSLTIQAKELTNRLGIGAKNNSAVELPQIAAVYYPSQDYALTGGLGIDTEQNQSKFGFNVGVRRLVFKESNLNFYMGGQFGMLNYEVNTDKKSGFELSALFGAEFFLPGLENLGITFEGGAGILSTTSVRFRTIADHPFRAGMIFYF